MNAKISVFVICVEAIIHLLLHDLHDYTFKEINRSITKRMSNIYLKVNIEKI